MPDPHPALLMFIGARYVEQRVSEAIAAAGYDDLTLAMARVAARLSEDGIRVTELAEQARITKQSASVLVDQLERAAYVVRVPDPADARARLVVIAPRGREVLDVARREERAIEREWTRHLGAERMAALKEALADLREITDPWLPGR
ncbi:MarR family winged helix-turn-helix transcriptional regulator [Nocardioides daeguensis]|uniref:MarR family winged helix-turn-helix transcriptional regulator n=1 Tax=Nocardioides daeguensis TaxID=908359 RepID=A0ABP6V3A4_9ACTN|nr:MarR family transcriptional regulator [Nocardioides daeguensis]MBV6727254.1 MarR family transcriptional regulator [Nocardioides daeguensis]MCR1771268.1 MarR family transcriptional regulator [Nocardioides daeguensis]